MRALLAHASLLVVASACLMVQAAGAQPKGPRDVINSAREQRDARELEAAVEAAPRRTDVAQDKAGVAQAQAASQGGDPHAEPPSLGAGLPQQKKPIAEGQESAALPKGTLKVTVVDRNERPLANAEVRVGVLKADGSRDSMEFRSDGSGTVIVPDLPVGDRQAYRAEVLAEGARFSSNPFRLPHDRGYEVLIRQLETTADNTEIVLYVGAVSVELKDERLKIAEQVRLINVGGKVFVFPEGGLQIPLPAGFTAFQAQDTMGDQRVESTETGLKIEGSLPPGQTTLLWGFDLPIEGEEMTVALHNPWTTFAFRVLADAAPGLAIRVDDLPPAELHEAEGGRYWVTEAARRPEDGPLSVVRIHLSGIPGPGPYRWFAVGFALLALAAGAFVARRPPNEPNAAAEAMLALRKRDLMEELRELSTDEKEGDVGPEFFAAEKARLTDALSLVLWEESQLSTKAPKS